MPVDRLLVDRLPVDRLPVDRLLVARLLGGEQQIARMLVNRILVDRMLGHQVIPLRKRVVPAAVITVSVQSARFASRLIILRPTYHVIRFGLTSSLVGKLRVGALLRDLAPMTRVCCRVEFIFPSRWRTFARAVYSDKKRRIRFQVMTINFIVQYNSFADQWLKWDIYRRRNAIK